MVGGHRTMRSIITMHYYDSDQIKEDEMGHASCTEIEKCTQIFNLKS
jgi:hypothetical protein